MPQAQEAKKAAKTAPVDAAAAKEKTSPKDALKGKSFAAQEAALKPQTDAEKYPIPKGYKAAPKNFEQPIGPNEERAWDHGNKDYSTGVLTHKKVDGKRVATGYDADKKDAKESPGQWAQSQYSACTFNVALRETSFFAGPYERLKSIATNDQRTRADVAQWTDLQKETAEQAAKAIEHIDGALKLLDARHAAVLGDKSVSAMRAPIVASRDTIQASAAAAARWARPQAAKK